MAASLTKTQSYAVGEWEVQTTATALTVTLVADDYLWIRQTLETTDPAVTPTLSLMEIELEVSGPTISTQAATNVTTTEATLNGNLTSLDGETSVDVFFQWKKTGDPAWTETAKQTVSATGVFDAAITSLDSDTEYQFRAVVEWNSGASIKYGSTLFFNTEAIVVPDGGGLFFCHG